ncbi:MAG: organoarsenical effux MFS transporter ArsJ [Candidatus Scalindua sp.]|nr:organoarsenical effux MFS transporter ArsJ [Candidatus Scalindua sp.]
MNRESKQYTVITGTYWAFTITDGALRMLVLLFFYEQGYSPMEIALLFLLYEFFGVVTNLVGGWIGARVGLNFTARIGIILQIIALGMLTVEAGWLTVPYVMIAQAISGIAKDLNKMSAKSAIKLLMPEQHQHGKLYKWVAVLTGSKNALKGAGFFLGAALLSWIGFYCALVFMMIVLAVTLIINMVCLNQQKGRTKNRPKFSHLFSKSRSVNILSAARLCLFGARDVWFVVAIPVYFQAVFHWTHTQVGTFMAAWIIGYGCIQSVAPSITGNNRSKVPDGRSALKWAIPLTFVPFGIAMFLPYEISLMKREWLLIIGLSIFGILFAINSSVHSFLILVYSKSEGVSLDVGFYYMANALGRLIGTVLSGALYQYYALEGCLFMSTIFLILTVTISIFLPK